MSVLKLLEKKNLAAEDLDSSEEESEDNNVSMEAEGEDEGEDVKEESAFKEQTNKEWKNRCRVLIVSGRGTAPGFRHMIKDIIDLIPHSKKEVSSYTLLYIYRLKLVRKQLLMMFWTYANHLHVTLIYTLNQEKAKICICGLVNTLMDHHAN